MAINWLVAILNTGVIMKNLLGSFSSETSASLLRFSSAMKFVTVGFARVVLFCATTLSVTTTFAQPIIDPSYPARVAFLRFQPPNPTVGQLVVPVVEGVWPNGCIPKAGQASGGSFRRSVTLSLVPATTSCSQAFQPYKLELPSIKFDRDGEYEYQLLGNTGEFYGLTSLTVFAVGSTIPQDVLAGLWFEPVTSGSGLFMARSIAGTADLFFGGWFYYSPAGTPTWVSFQEGVWQSPGVLVGNIYETNADPKTCFPFDPACTIKWLPAPATKINKVGSFKITVTSVYSAELVVNSSVSSSRTIQLIKQMR
jgi:hypothetical protein